MKKYNCLIVEDEPLAQKVLESYIQKIPFLELKAQAYTAFEAYDELSKNRIDLLFCDIQMPMVTGIEFLRSLPTKPEIIMTTAFHEYAFDGFELDVIDYLLKPISFERFLRAIRKIKGLNNASFSEDKSKVPETEKVKVENEDYVFVKEDGNYVKILFDDIYFIEGMKDYVKIFTKNKTIVSYLTLKKIEETFPKHLFIRIHKSYLVSLNKINAIKGNMIETINQVQIPVGMQYKDSVFDKIGPNILLR
jgi:two-component system, LytTR family, response regulator